MNSLRPLVAALLAAQPALAATTLEKSVVRPVELVPLPAPLSQLTPTAIPSLTVPTLPQLDAAVPQVAAPDAAPASPTTIQSLTATGEKIATSESPMDDAKTLGTLYDKSKSGGDAAPAFSNPPPEMPAGALVGGRLSRDVMPKEYAVSLKVDPNAEGFSGRVKISAAVSKPVKRLVLHSLGHAITDIIVTGERLDAKSIVVDPVTETFAIPLDQELPAGAATIELAYTGQYNKQMRGLYESKAKHEGQEERYAFTHLEPTNARRVFPAFDEPDFKASFKTTIEAPERLTVLSNMPAASRSVSGGFQTVSFEATPKMSTYLFALAVARLEPQTRVVDGTKITVWTMPQDAGQAGFALDTAENALKRLNAYFGLKYQLPKMDLVAVPDFAAGAMENWGAIFFRDSALLADPKLSSSKARRRVAEVVTHEIVHQWFGNLVTMKWWNDLWLNEAFATWMAYKMVAPWRPDWNEWIEFEQRKREPLAIDALKTTRAISAGVSSTSEIQAQFDPLTYSKGGALLRMIEGYLGEDKFRAGIQAYMRRYRFGNTEANDLWRALEKASGQPVMKMAEDWLGKPGYPIVTVAQDAKNPRTLTLSQRRFSASGEAQAPSRWTIPLVINYRLKGEKKERTYRALLDAGAKTITLPGKGKPEWIYANDDETGFYRVKLEGKLSAALRARAKELSDLERMGLLNGLWAQAKNGEIRLSEFLDAAVALKRDGSRVVLEEISSYLKALNENFAASPKDKAALKRLASDLLGPHWKRLGWSAKRPEGDEPGLARTAVLSALGAVAPDSALKAGLKSRLASYLKDPSSLEPALAAPVLSLSARLSIASFDDYRERFLSATTPEQRDSFLMSMAQFRDPALARRLLAMTLSDEVRGQDAWKPYGALLANSAVQDEAWAFVRANWAALKEKLGPRGSERVIGATGGLRGRARLEEVRAFFSDPANAVPSAKRTLDQTLESIELSARFAENQGPELSRWLAKHYP
jgi:puromycin-sensitive aminopeptidase